MAVATPMPSMTLCHGLRGSVFWDAVVLDTVNDGDSLMIFGCPVVLFPGRYSLLHSHKLHLPSDCCRLVHLAEMRTALPFQEIEIPANAAPRLWGDVKMQQRINLIPYRGK